MVERTLTKRFIARIAVGCFGGILALYSFFTLIFSPIFPIPAEQWHNVLYILIFLSGALIIQFAREDFDRNG